MADQISGVIVNPGGTGKVKTVITKTTSRVLPIVIS